MKFLVNVFSSLALFLLLYFSQLPIVEAVSCDYSLENDKIIYSTQVDVYNGKYYIKTKLNDNYVMMKVYNGNNSDVMEIMNLAKIAQVLGSKVNICYYNYSSGAQIYALELQ
ncbi:hypothetical protein H0S68_25455 (plasmid) [Serratia sp. AXJ-M]|uniref:hypothetical protein n=1 Tax=Serratia sp. AXJ-M TaxID=2754727 RepID=UPI00397BC4BA